MLRFTNGVTSAGWLVDDDRFPLDESLSAAEEWSRWLAEFPSIASQFCHCAVSRSARRPAPHGRLQRRVQMSAADGWAMLPATAYTLDALHSTGNAHTLAGIERLVKVLEEHWQKPALAAKLADYDRILQLEISHLDRLVHGSYRSMGQFELFAAFAMFYFIAAHNSEARRREGRVGEPFLWAAEPAFQAVLAESYQQLLAITDGRPASPDEIRTFARQVSRGLAPFNIAGLMFPDGEGFAGGLVDV